MALFRKKETYNEQMLREAGLDRVVFTETGPLPTLGAPTLPDGSRVDRKEWDATASLGAPGIAGDQVKFTVIPEGDLIVAEETGDGDLSPLADALERHIQPPYRAVGTRQEGDLWAVGARRIKVAKFSYPEGEKLELSWNQIHDYEFRVDGEPSHQPAPPELFDLGRVAGSAFFIEAMRIDGDLWEYRATGF